MRLALCSRVKSFGKSLLIDENLCDEAKSVAKVSESPCRM